MISGRAPEAPHRRAGYRSIASIAVIAVGALLLLAFVVPVTAAGVFRYLNPDWALDIAPWDARARAVTARRSLLARQRDPGILPGATADAQRAFRRDALAADAVGAAGLVAAMRRDEARANALFEYSDRLTRREPETQLWLLEQDVQRDDVRGALRHYDVVLRTSPRLHEVLFPILISASSDPRIGAELNRLLRTRPAWARPFLTHLAYSGRNPGAMVRVSRGLLDPAVAEQREILLILLGRLVTLRRYDLAWAVYDDVQRGSPRRAALVRDGDFSADGGIPPFDWEFSRDAQLVPERRSREGGEGYALFLPGAPAAHGESARQLLRLPPGGYELRAVVGDVPADTRRRPFLAVSCAAGSGASLLEADFPEAGSAARPLAGRFDVGPQCPHQWLAIWVRGNPDADTEFTDTGATQPWIGSIALRRR